MAELTEDDRMLAAEFALRLLEGDEHDSAALRMREDADFAAEVARWHEDLALLADTLDPVPPSAAARRALMERVFGSTRGRIGGWILGGFTGAAIAAALLLVAINNDLLVPASAPEYIAELQAGGRDLRIAAAYDSGSGTLRLTRFAGEPAPSGRATELWAIAPDNAPVSLGIVPAVAVWQTELPQGLRTLASNLTLAISDEPAGGSPTGQPTGAVLAAVPLK